MAGTPTTSLHPSVASRSRTAAETPRRAMLHREPGRSAHQSAARDHSTTGGADPTTLLEAYASAQAQYDSAVSALAALRQPKATHVASAQARLARVEATLRSAEQTAAGATLGQVATCSSHR